jgi:arginyl-tRNA synthetase
MQEHLSEIPSEAAPIEKRTAFLGQMYVEGTKAYDADPLVKNEIDELNQAIYDKSDDAVNDLYEKGRQWSLDHFEMLYELLGTKFDDQIFESEAAPVGLEIVRANIGKVFEESDGAIVFKGEKFGLHTRVFINSHGLPTYETKDVGLNATKFKKYPLASQSVIVTANEQNEYFKVLTKVFSLLDEKNGSKTTHIGHGMLRFADGKMSSRTGNVVTADALIADMKKLVMEKIADRKFSPDEADEIADIIAVGAIKYTILRQTIGGNVVFDSTASISFEGDSGPYLQYSAVRAASILEKAGVVGGFSGPAGATLGSGPRTIETSTTPAFKIPNKVGLLEKLIVRFPDIAERARDEYAPQIVANYLITLAGAFNAFYATQTIIDEKDPLSAYRLALTRAFLKTMTEGLWLLGIKVPKRM